MLAREIRALSDEEIRRLIDERYEELFNLRFQKAIGQLKDSSRFKQVRRDIARMKTILRERELARAAKEERA